MKLSDTSIRRPVLASVMSLLIVLVGVVSFDRLSLREYPRIDEPVVTVNTVLTGASSEVIESQVTKPLEDSIAGIDGVDIITSISRAERSQISVRFKLEKSPDDAAADVRDRVSRVRGRLPDAIDEPIVAKVEADATPTIWLAFNSETLSPLEVTDLINRIVKPRLQTVPGVADIQIGGDRKYAMRIWLDPDKLAAYRVTVQDVEDALRKQNLEVPSGRIESQQREFNVTTRTDLNTVEQFADITLRSANNFTVHLRDVGRVEEAAASERSRVRLNGVPSISTGVIRNATANPLEVAAGVRALMPLIQRELPDSVTVVQANDLSVFIDRSVKSVYATVAEAVVLVALVVFVFLRTLRASIIPLVTIPVSLVGSFALIALAGFTINTLTLLALVLAIGLVVDDAIVVLENIFRHIEEGFTPFQAAIKGVREISFAVVAMTLTLTAVFAPLAFTPGRTGRLFTEFALTLAGAVLVSGFVALTLTPMLCSKLLRHNPAPNRFDRGMEVLLVALTNGYTRTLRGVLAHRWVVLVIMAVSAGLSWWLFSTAKSELSPLEDRGVIIMPVRAPDGATLDFTARYLDAIDAIAATYPEFDRRFMFLGGGQVSTATAVLRTVDWSERTRNTAELARSMLPQLNVLPGVTAFPITPPSLGQGFRERPINYVILTSDSYDNLARVSQQFMAEMAKNSGFVQPDSDLQLNKPEIFMDVDRARGRHGHRSRLGGPHSGNHARRARCDALQARCRPVRRHGADRGPWPCTPGRHRSPLRARPRRDDGAVVVTGQGARGRQPARAESLQPAALGLDHGQSDARLLARPGAGLSRSDRRARTAAGLHHRTQRCQPRISLLVGCAGFGLHTGSGLHIPGAVGAVRKLPRPVRDPAVGTAIDGRRTARVAVVGRDLECVFANRADHAGWADQQTWDPDRRVQQSVATPRHGRARGRGRGGQSAAAADHHDHQRDGARCLAACAIEWCRCREPAPDRLGHRRWHVARHAAHDLCRADGLHLVCAQGCAG
jgi:multidrug efflux pump